MTTLQDMLDILRQRTNMENNQFVTDAELTGYLNSSLSLLDGFLISKFNDYKLTSASLTTTTDELTLPSDFFKLRGLDVLDSGNYVTLKSYSFQHRNRKSRQNLGLAQSIEYRLQGSVIKLTPADIAPNYTYQLWYVPDFISLSAVTDTLEPYMDSQAWYEYAISDSAIKVLTKQDLDPSVHKATADGLKEHILKMSAPNRDAGEPACVVNTRDYNNDWSW